MENIEKIEQEILETVKSKVLPETKPAEIEAMIKAEIINKKYLLESDWQFNYAVERIAKQVEPIEKLQIENKNAGLKNTLTFVVPISVFVVLSKEFNTGTAFVVSALLGIIGNRLYNYWKN